MLQVDDLLRSYLRAGDAQDYRVLSTLLHDQLVTHSPGGVTISGVEAPLRAWRSAHRGLDQLEHRVMDVVADDETAAARVRVTGVHTGWFLGIPPTGARITVDQALFARREGDRLVELWEIVDTGSGLQQLGVLEGQQLGPG